MCLMFQPHTLAARRYGLKLGVWKIDDLFKHNFYFLVMLTFLPGGEQCALQGLNNLLTDCGALQEGIWASGRGQ